MSFKSDHKESAKIMTHVWAWGLSIAALIGVIVLATYLFYPHLLTLERKAVVNSHQYVEARKSAITTTHSQWIQSKCGSKPENAICKSLVSRIRAEATKIDQAMMTPDIESILIDVGVL